METTAGIQNLIEAQDGRQPTYVSPDFVEFPVEHDFEQGTAWRVCYEKIEGRWEGFVSIVGRRGR